MAADVVPDVSAIYAEHWEAICRFFRRRMPWVPPADIEDLTAAVFERVCLYAPRYQERGVPINAWLYRIARNILTDEWRARAIRPIVCETASDAPGGRATLDAGSDRQIDAMFVAEAMLHIPPRYRLVLAERFLMGASHRETALILGVSESGSRKLQSYALAALRVALVEMVA